MTDLWQRLKQRKLVQWAAAYPTAESALLDKHAFTWSPP